MSRLMRFFVFCLVLPAGAPHQGWALSSLERTTEPSSLVVRKGSLFFSDKSDSPVKRIDLIDGGVMPLAQKLGAPSAFSAGGDAIYWIEERSGISPSGNCTGPGAIIVLHRTTLDGGQTRKLAEGDNCAGMGASQSPIVHGDSLFWVTSTTSPNTYRINEVSLTTGTSSVVHFSEWQPISAMVKDATHLFWQEGAFPDAGVIKKMPLAGGPAGTVFEPQASLSGGMVIEGGSLFFATMGFPNSRRLQKLSVAGGVPAVIHEAVENDPFKPRNSISKLISDGGFVYWHENDSINRVATDGKSFRRLASNLISKPLDMLVFGGSVMWSGSTGTAHGEKGFIKKMASSGGASSIMVRVDGRPLGMAVAGDRLYWLEGGPISSIEGGGRIAAMPLSGGDVITMAMGVSDNSPLLAADDAFVYIADAFTIKKVPLLGGKVRPLANASFYIKGLAAGGDSLFWSEDPMTSLGGVSVNGGDVTKLAAGMGPAGPVRYDSGFIYWMDHFDSIKRMPAAGGTEQTLARDLPLLSDFVVSGNEVFFAENNTGAIKKLTISTGVVSLLAGRSAMASPRSLAVDDTFLYWIDQAEVGKIARTGGTPEIIASGLDVNPHVQGSIAVDDSGLYWTETGSGLIRTTASRTMESAGYFPLTAGTVWNYASGSGGTVSRTVLADKETVNGVLTSVIQQSDGYKQYITNDGEGIRLHREHDPSVDIGNGGETADFIFLTPLVYAKPTMTSGQSTHSSGNVRLELSRSGTFALSYEAESIPEGFETLDLAAGHFKTGRLRTTVRIFGSFLGWTMDVTVTNVFWMAMGIGPVQWAEYEGGDTDVGKLASTSISYADLAVFHSAVQPRYRLGEDVVLRYVVYNRGPKATGSVVLENVLPQGLTYRSASPGCSHGAGKVTCGFASLARGASLEVSVTARADQAGSPRNAVSVSAAEVDPDGDDNAASEIVSVIADQDGDGIADDVESGSCTEVAIADSDEDGLADGLEDVNRDGKLDAGETDACKKDTDDDGMPDGWEWHNGTDPLVPDDDGDRDNDGFTNLQEYQAGTNPLDWQSIPVADLNGDGRTDLADAILAIGVLSGRDASGIRPDIIASGCDVDGDGRIGLPEVSFILRSLSRMR